MSGVVVPQYANFMFAHCYRSTASYWQRKGASDRRPWPDYFLANAERAADFAPSRSTEPYTAANRLLGRPTLVWLVT